MGPTDRGLDNLWEIIEVGDDGNNKDGYDVVGIRSIRNGKFLNVARGGMFGVVDGTNVQIHGNSPTDRGQDNLWRILKVKGHHPNCVGFQSVSSGKCLNVCGAGMRDGTNIQIHGGSPTDRGQDNLWRIVEV